MTITLLIIAYVLNVFLNRWLDKIRCGLSKYNYPVVFTWFIPVATTLALTACILIDTEFKENWFTGKYWK
jgi:hypothetical protein